MSILIVPIEYMRKLFPFTAAPNPPVNRKIRGSDLPENDMHNVAYCAY
jgi:hypothetical protein